MSCLLDKLAEKNIRISVRILDEKDGADIHYANLLLENYSFVCRIIAKSDLSAIDSMDQYLDYLFFRKLSELRWTIQYLKAEEAQKRLDSLLGQAETEYKKVKPGSVIRFVNAQYESIWGQEYSKYSISERSLKTIAPFQNGISPDVFKYLAEHKYCLIIDNFQDIRVAFEKHPELFGVLFDKNRLQEIMIFRLESVFFILKRYYKSEVPAISSTVHQVIDFLIGDTQKMISDLTEKNIQSAFLAFSQYQKLTDFLVSIQHIKANWFQKQLPLVRQQYNSVLEREAKSYVYTVNVRDFFAKISQYPTWESKIVALTHKYLKEGKQFVIRSEFLMSHRKNSIYTDLAATNRKTDEHFTLSFQQDLEQLAAKRSAYFITILQNKAYFSEFISGIKQMVSKIKCCISTSSDVVGDLELFENMVESVRLYKQTSTTASTGAPIYGVAMFLCASIEKILRLLYSYIAEDKFFVSEKHLTLGSLLVDDEKVLAEFFPKNYLKNMAFFLSTTGESCIGYNLRNRLAHWEIDDPRCLDDTLIALLLYIYVDVINTIYTGLLNTQKIEEGGEA